MYFFSFLSCLDYIESKGRDCKLRINKDVPEISGSHHDEYKYDLSETLHSVFWYILANFSGELTVLSPC